MRVGVAAVCPGHSRGCCVLVELVSHGRERRQVLQGRERCVGAAQARGLAGHAHGWVQRARQLPAKVSATARAAGATRATGATGATAAVQ
jgi:hypothetical protein